MGKNYAVYTHIQYLLGNPLVHLSAVGRDPHHGCHRRGKYSPPHYLAAVEHVLEGISQTRRVEGTMLHLEGDAVKAEVARVDALSMSTGVNPTKAVPPSSNTLMTPFKRGNSGMIHSLLFYVPVDISKGPRGDNLTSLC